MPTMPPTIYGKPTALLIIDMQNGFVKPGGTFAKLGLDISHHEAAIAPIQALRTLANAAHMPVIFSRMGFAADYADAGILMDMVPGVQDMQGFVRGTWDSALVAEFGDAPRAGAGAGEEVLDKTRNSAFWGTGLAERLRALGVRQVLVTGVATNVCVESTVRDAFQGDFYALVVRDATATLSVEEHEAAMVGMKYFAKVVSCAEIEAELAMGGKEP